jgi:hypothetical protein
MKKVLQISKYYYPFLGGTEQVARDLAWVLAEMDGVEQKIICFNEDAADGSMECHKEETVRAYAAALKKLARDDDLRKRYGKAARQRILDNFTMEQFWENVRKLIG